VGEFDQQKFLMLATLQRLKPKLFHSYYCEKIYLMKNAIFLGFLALTLATTFSSCKKNTNKTNYDYSPPSWLIGNWNDSVFSTINNYNTFGFKITSDDVIQVSGSELSWKTMNENANVPSQEETNGNTYHITLSNGAGAASNYYFVKVSSNKIKFYTVNPNLNPNYTVLLRY
jgi:hypothetical protein